MSTNQDVKNVADAERFHHHAALGLTGTVRSPGFRTCTKHAAHLSGCPERLDVQVEGSAIFRMVSDRLMTLSTVGVMIDHSDITLPKISKALSSRLGYE